jgi:hypothetical protein
MEQQEFILPAKKREQPADSIIFGCTTMAAAVRLMISVSGYQEDQVACALGYTTSHFSEILSGKKNIPWSKQGDDGKGGINEAMDFCESDLPLIWWCNKRGFQRPKLKQTELEKKYEELERKFEAVLTVAREGLLNR